jgi:hypothetical protein
MYVCVNLGVMRLGAQFKIERQPILIPTMISLFVQPIRIQHQLEGKGKKIDNNRSTDIDCIHVSMDMWVQSAQNNDTKGLSEISLVSI